MDLDSPSFVGLVEAADAMVAAAFSAGGRKDPILGPEFGRLHGVAMALTRGHGLLLENAVAEALRHSGLFEVSRNLRFPVTEAAKRVVAANAPDLLPRIRLTFDSEAVHTVDLDLAAVTVDGSRALAVDIKRGVGATGGTRRAALERDLLSVRLLLRSFFRQRGYHVDEVSVGVVDLFGASGFSPRLGVGRDGVDRFFGTAVLPVVDAVTDHVRSVVQRRLPELITLAPPLSAARHGASALLEVDDTPVASVRSPWADMFSARPRRAGASR